MRFSLGTLMLFVLFVSSAYALAMLRGPWYLAKTFSPFDDTQQQSAFYNQSTVSPDGTRVLRWFFDADSVSNHFALGVFENKPDGKMLCLFTTEFVAAANFRTDDEVDVLHNKSAATSSLCVYRRRYAETTLGYMTRPEFLLMAGSLIWLMVRLIRRVGRKNCVKIVQQGTE